jgi:MFS family permease
MILFLPQALAPNVASIIASRFVQGTFACIEGPVAAGVVADLFPKAVRGPAMGTFVLTVFTAKWVGHWGLESWRA